MENVFPEGSEGDEQKRPPEDGHDSEEGTPEPGTPEGAPPPAEELILQDPPVQPPPPPPPPSGDGPSGGDSKDGEEHPTPFPLPFAGLSAAVSRLVQGTLHTLRRLACKPGALATATKWSVRVGLDLVLVLGAVGLVFAIVESVRQRSVTFWLVGVVGALGAVGLHYAAGQFVALAQRTLAETPAVRAPWAMIDCIGLFALAGALIMLAVGIYSATFRFPYLWPRLLHSVAFAILAAFALAPKEAVGVEAEEANEPPRQAALGLLEFLARCLLAGAPLMLGPGLAIGLAWAVVSIAITWAGGMEFPVLAFRASVQITLLPLFAYLLFLAYRLLLDFYLAVVEGKRLGGR